jgi:hypothetical protein
MLFLLIILVNMKKQFYVISLFMSFGLISITSQNIDKPLDVLVNDFKVEGTRSIYLYYRSLFTFPYREDYKLAGARDWLFDLKNETYLRILLNNKDTSVKFFVIDRYYDFKPEIKSLTCYFLNNKKVFSNKINVKKTDLFIKEDQGYFMDLSAFKRIDKNVLIDVIFTYPIKSKKEINFYLDNRMDYKFLLIRIEVPEIYKYSISYERRYLIEEINKPRLGPTIGYTHPGMRNSRFMSKYDNEEPYNRARESANKSNINIPPLILSPVQCFITPFNYKLIDYNFSESNDSIKNYPAILSLDLSMINEIIQ